MDRFSHLVIYTAIRCLMVGRSELWQRFNKGDNLLFRESDFRHPEASELLRTFWRIDDAHAQALVGRLVLACRQPLEESALLHEIVTADGQIASLNGDERTAIEAALGVEATQTSKKPSVESHACAGFIAAFRSLRASDNFRPDGRRGRRGAANPATGPGTFATGDIRRFSRFGISNAATGRFAIRKNSSRAEFAGADHCGDLVTAAVMAALALLMDLRVGPRNPRSKWPPRWNMQNPQNCAEAPRVADS